MTKAKQGQSSKARKSFLDSVDLSKIPVEKISEEEAEELSRLSKEVDEEGISWKRLRAELDLYNIRMKNRKVNSGK